MKIRLVPGSHVDHIAHLTYVQRELLMDAANAAVADCPPGVSVVQFDVPQGVELTTDLYENVSEKDVTYVVRPGRRCASRVLLGAKPQPTTTAVVVIGPDKPDDSDDNERVLYTIYGGTKSLREPGDRSIATMEEIIAARDFWYTRALAYNP